MTCTIRYRICEKMAEDAPKDIPGSSEEDCERIDVEFPKLFYVSNMVAVKDVIQNYELRTKSQFAANRETKNFASNWSIFSGMYCYCTACVGTDSATT